MAASARYKVAVQRIKSVLTRPSMDVKTIVEARDEVLNRFGSIFQIENIDGLDEETFREFLLFENNKHWTGLYRQSGKITQDMDALRSSLKILLDESRPVAERLDEAVSRVTGMGRAIATAILLVAYPEKYGVWNSVSEDALKKFEIWPKFAYGASLGQRYKQINQILLKLAQDVGVDLWTLDALFWGVVRKDGNGPPVPGPSDTIFVLERHLHDFLVDNWDKTPIGKDWSIYSEEREELAGVEYPTGIGRIDILAKHQNKPEWLVIELKKGRSSDEVVGQLLRYIGWVKHELAKNDETVRGMIVTHEADPKLLYAVRALEDDRIQVLRYRVQFDLHPVDVSKEIKNQKI